MRIRCHLCSLIGLAILLALGSKAPVHASFIQGSSDIDVMFLVDTSVEMQANDPDGTRLQAMQAIIDLTRGRGSQRVGVMGLSGDEEQRLLLPLTRLPQDLTGSRSTLEGTIGPLIEGVGSSGDGLTILETFEELGRIHDGQGQHLWVVLLTNGDADPVGEQGLVEDVPASARARAQELADEENGYQDSQISRDHLKAAVKGLLPSGAQAVLAALGDTTLTIINVGATAEDRSGVLEPLSQAASGTDVLDLKANNIRQVAEEAIAQAPFPPRSTRLIRRAQEGSESQRIHIYQGTKEARLVIAGAHGDYDARLTPVGGGAALATAASKGPVKSLWMTSPAPAPGAYELEIENRGGNLNPSVNLEFELALSAVVTAPEAGTRAVGSDLELGFRLQDFNGQVVSDAQLLRGGNLTLSWTDPGGDPAPVAWALTGDEPLERSFTLAPADSSEGKRTYGWTIATDLLPDGSGGFDWKMAPESGSVSVEFSMPKLRFTSVSSTGDSEIDAAGSSVALAFSNDYLSGTSSHSATVQLEVDLLGMAEIPVMLSYSAADSSGKASATILMDGEPVGSGSTVVFRDGTPGSISIEVTKEGFGPFQGDIGTLQANVASGAPIQTTLAMGSHPGGMTGLAILLLLLLLLLGFFVMKKMARKRAWMAVLDGLDDDAVLYFEDDEKGAA